MIEVEYARTEVRTVKGKPCIIQRQDDTSAARSWRRDGVQGITCKRGRVCSGVNCPCYPSAPLNETQEA